MKTLKLTILFTLTSLAAVAQGNYEETMSKTIMDLYQTEKFDQYDRLANTFNRIAQVETKKWEPRYYEGLTHVFKSMQIADASAKDATLDAAHKALSLASEIDPKNSEIVALQGFTDMMKLTVDPASRGQSMTPKIMAAFGKAMGLNPNNPRATMFMAQMQIGTAQFFGSPITEPCALIDKAEMLFKNAKPSSPLAPMWGEQSIAQYKDVCSQPTDN